MLLKFILPHVKNLGEGLKKAISFAAMKKTERRSGRNYIISAALLFKQVLAKSKAQFFAIMAHNGIPSDFIKDIDELAQSNHNQT
jgi:hypothetical protein